MHTVGIIEDGLRSLDIDEDEIDLQDDLMDDDELLCDLSDILREALSDATTPDVTVEVPGYDSDVFEFSLYAYMPYIEGVTRVGDLSVRFHGARDIVIYRLPSDTRSQIAKRISESPVARLHRRRVAGPF